MKERDFGTYPTYALGIVLLQDPDAFDQASRVAQEHDDYELKNWVENELLDYIERLPDCWQKDCIFQLLLEDQEVHWYELHERLLSAQRERDEAGE